MIHKDGLYKHDIILHGINQKLVGRNSQISSELQIQNINTKYYHTSKLSKQKINHQQNVFLST